MYFLKQKSDALGTFKQFLTYVKTQFHTNIKALQYDFGGEYRPFTKFLNELGIIHRLTCPHTLHQNGTAEIKHRSIVKMGLTLLAPVHMPIDYWDHAFTASVHLIKRLPTTTLPNSLSPFQALFHKVPDYSTLRVFG